MGVQGDQKSQETETNINDRGIDEATFPLHQVRAHTLPARAQAASRRAGAGSQALARLPPSRRLRPLVSTPGLTDKDNP